MGGLVIILVIIAILLWGSLSIKFGGPEEPSEPDELTEEQRDRYYGAPW